MTSSFDRTLCPTCGGNGHREHPFDANCPAAWAHGSLASWAELKEVREFLLEGKPDHADDSLLSLVRLAIGSLRHIGKTTRDAYEKAESELSSLKSSQITAEEAAAILMSLDRQIPPRSEEWHAIAKSADAKLRALRGSAGEK